MKNILSLLSLAALTVGLLGSCSKINERIDGLDKRVYDLENSRIASIEQQITAINTSINNLKAADAIINGKIDDLKTTAEAHQALIDALKEADKALGQKDDALEARIATLEGQVAIINGQIKTLEDADKAINLRIDELKTYVNEELANAKDWASATFATLTQYQQTADDLAALSVTVTGISTTLAGVQTSISGLDTKIDGIDAALQGRIADAKTELEGKIADLKTELEGKIAEAISTSETTLKGWVNERLSAYCTIAQMEAEIADLQSEIDALKNSKADKAKIDELETSLDKLSADLSQAKADIKSAYEKAIKDAIEGNDGYITETIKNAIDDANTNITALTGRVETLESTVAALSGDVDALKAMIQTVSVIPAYNDGSLKAEGGILTINCVITPKDAVDGLTKDNFTVLTSEVLTRSGLYGTIAIANDEDLVLDTDNGTATIRVDVSAVLPAEADKALTVALNVKNGISDYTTDFVPVYAAAAPGPVLPEGALTGKFSVSASKQIQFSKGNLVATIDASGTPTAWKFAANQYDCLGEGGANKTIGTAAGDIDLFGWSTAASKYGISTSTSSSDYSGDFVDWGKNIGDGSTWRTLSKDEWTYLFNTTSRMVNSKPCYSNAVSGVSIGGTTYKGVFIYPDNYNGNEVSSSMTWDQINAAGIIFLPAAGYRDGSNVGYVGDFGYYWSSTALGSDSAFSVGFNSSEVSPGNDDHRDFGFNVRLITECQ